MASCTAARRAASQELRRLYLLDYVRVWDEYLADLRLLQGGSLLENIQLARTLSMADSPLKQLVQQVALQTRLLREDAQQGASLGAQAKVRLDDTRQALEQMFGPVGLEGSRRNEPQAKQVEAIVDQHFEPYHRLASSSGGAPAPIDGTLELLDEFYAFLTSSDAALRSAGTPPQSNVLTKLQAEAGRLPGPLRDAQAGENNDALFTESTLAFEPRTGRLAWYYQHNRNDQFDLDWVRRWSGRVHCRRTTWQSPPC